MAWIGAAVAGGVALMGDTMAQQGQQATNAMTLQEINQEEGWETQMSDTAVQRRKADLTAAGINPLLAAGDPASTPGIGVGQLQNPNAAFGNLGQQATNAVQTAQQGQQVQSTVNLQSAQAAKAQADAALSTAQAVKTAGVDTDLGQSTIASQQVQQELNKAQVQQTNANTQLTAVQQQVAQATLPKIQAEIAAIGASKSLDEARTHLTNVQSIAGQLSNTQFQSIMPDVITSAANAAKSSSISNQLSQLSLPQATAESSMWQHNSGLAYVNAVMNWLHIGANIGGSH